MNYYTQLATKSDCYKAGKKISVKGLMLHSTGANNTKLSRYVQPDDGKLGDNPNNNDWNQPGISKMVHAFIGKLKDGSIATYQTLPWDHRGWGGGGKSNDTHIHVEICEDNLQDPAYFKAVYDEAVRLFAHLATYFKLNPDTAIITHSEGHKQGIASNHGDVMHWFPKHGKSMDTFRKDVKALMVKASAPKPAPTSSAKPAEESYEQFVNKLAQHVIQGLYGSGDERKKKLGAHYNAVQARVNELSGGSKPKPAQKSISQLADEVLKGLHGNGVQRQKSLGSNYAAVQAEVTRRLKK